MDRREVKRLISTDDGGGHAHEDGDNDAYNDVGASVADEDAVVIVDVVMMDDDGDNDEDDGDVDYEGNGNNDEDGNGDDDGDDGDDNNDEEDAKNDEMSVIVMDSNLNSRRLLWFGHVTHMPDGSIPKDILLDEL
uniref:Uncharacterized protein n=1 Tax=Biomphalaria glabrata TaxID=6526 RepID=A0A2C9LS54_BIOGL